VPSGRRMACTRVSAPGDDQPEAGLAQATAGRLATTEAARASARLHGAGSFVGEKQQRLPGGSGNGQRSRGGKMLVRSESGCGYKAALCRLRQAR
jgi:hypothetical protein